VQHIELFQVLESLGQITADGGVGIDLLLAGFPPGVVWQPPHIENKKWIQKGTVEWSGG